MKFIVIGLYSSKCKCVRVFRTKQRTFWRIKTSKRKTRKLVLDDHSLRKYCHYDSPHPDWSVSLKGLYHSLLKNPLPYYYTRDARVVHGSGQVDTGAGFLHIRNVCPVYVKNFYNFIRPPEVPEGFMF